jgi:hypothetical protein
VEDDDLISIDAPVLRVPQAERTAVTEDPFAPAPREDAFAVPAPTDHSPEADGSSSASPQAEGSSPASPQAEGSFSASPQAEGSFSASPQAEGSFSASPQAESSTASQSEVDEPYDRYTREPIEIDEEPSAGGDVDVTDEVLVGGMVVSADSASRSVPDLSPMMEQQIQEALEKVAWEAFSDLSESIVKQVMGRVEQIAWEVIPQMAETLVREEIRRMKGDDD